MKIVYMIIFFILGTCMGSFYTVVGLRLPKKEDFIKKRSHCDSCKHPLTLLDMIPIISYIILRGKCHYCHKKINPQSTYMELFSGILFALAYYLFGFKEELYITIGIISLLEVIAVSDITYYIIPDEVLFFSSGYFLIIITLYQGVVAALLSLFSGIVLFTFMYGIMLLGNFIFKKETLGGGDIKLMFVIGLVLNPLSGVFVIFLSSLIALPISLIILWKKKKNLVPFGPFLVVSFLIIYITKFDIYQLLKFLSH